MTAPAATVTRQEIAAGLRALGVTPGRVILVHSSLRSFGHVAGGADAVIAALLDAVGPCGTVLVPTLTGRREDGPACPPQFDVRHTPCWTGLIPETFRRRPAARRSLHPTHSVAAIGPHADDLLRDHLAAPTPCGPGSPYLRLADRDGLVVFLGVTLACCTLLHGVEELAGCPYHLQPAPTLATITDGDGRTFTHAVALHSWEHGRRFPLLEPVFLREGALVRGRIGAAEVRALRARAAVEIALRLLREDINRLCEPVPT